MKPIDSVTLSNYRAHRHTVIEPGPVNYLTGPNGSGKSTVLAALEWLGTGKCTLTDEAGRGGDLVARGAQSGSVVVKIGKDTITRDTAGGLDLSWVARPKASQLQPELEAHLGIVGANFRAALRAGRFFGMGDKDQAGLLADLLQLGLTPDIVKPALAKKEKDAGLPLLRVLNRVGPKSMWEGERFDVERVHKVLVEERKLTKRVASELKAQIGGITDAEAYIPSGELEEKLARHAELSSESQQVAREIGQLEAVEKHSAGLAQALDAARQTLEEAVARLLGLPDSVAMEELAAAKARVAELDAETDRNCAEMQALTEKRTAQSAAVRLVAQLESEVESAGLCPWSEGLVCHGAAARRAAAAEKVTAAQAQVTDCEAASSSAVAAVRSQRPQTEIAQERSGLLAKIASWESAAEARRVAVNDEASAHRELQRLESQAASIAQPNPGRLADLRAYHPGLLELIAELGERLDVIKAEHTMREHQDGLRRRWQEKSGDVACLEALVKFFAADGFPAEHLQEQIEPMMNVVNAVLAPFGMESMYTADLTLQVRDKDQWFGYKSLSDAAQIKVGLAHQAAFAILAEVGMLVVDRVESLDDESLSALLDACAVIKDYPGMNHVFLIGVRRLSLPDWVKVFELNRVEVAA